MGGWVGARHVRDTEKFSLGCQKDNDANQNSTDWLRQRTKTAKGFPLKFPQGGFELCPFMVKVLGGRPLLFQKECTQQMAHECGPVPKNGAGEGPSQERSL